jgi:hypothetical protein
MDSSFFCGNSLLDDFDIRTGSVILRLEKDHKRPNLLDQSLPQRVKCGTFYQIGLSTIGPVLE